MEAIQILKDVARAIALNLRGGRALPELALLIVLCAPTLAYVSMLFGALLLSPFHVEIHFQPTEWQMAAIAASGAFVLRFTHCTVTQARRSAGTIATKACGTGEQAGNRLDWLKAEAEAQRIRLGLTVAPDVFVFDPHAVREGSPFAHVGLLDRGRVAVPTTWMAVCDDRELSYVVGHELAHIKHRDGIIRATTNTVIDVFIFFPSALLVAAVTVVVLFATAIAAVIIAVQVLQLLLGSPQALLAIPSGIARLSVAVMSAWPVAVGLKWLGLLIFVGGILSLYGRYVTRSQETRADFMATRVAGFDAAVQCLELLAAAEKEAAKRTRMTSAKRRWQIQGWIWAWLWMLPRAKGHEHNVRAYVCCASRRLAGLLVLAARLPGSARAYGRVAAFWKEHPPTDRRLLDVMAAREHAQEATVVHPAHITTESQEGSDGDRKAVAAGAPAEAGERLGGSAPE